MRLFIDKGWLIEEREVTDSNGDAYTNKRGEPYIGLLTFQVYDENGDPSTRSYRGPGEIHGSKIFLGDPQTTTNLLEGTVDRQATSESWDHYAGFRLAITSAGADGKAATGAFLRSVSGLARWLSAGLRRAENARRQEAADAECLWLNRAANLPWVRD